MADGFPDEEEMTAFLLDNGIDEKASMVLWSASPVVQRFVLKGGSLAASQNASSAMMSRIKAAQRRIGTGELKSGIVHDADDFIMINGLDEKAAWALKSCSNEVQQIVMDRGSLAETRNPASALSGRIRDATNAVKGCGKGDISSQQSPMMQMMGQGDMSSQQNPMMQMMQMMMSAFADPNPPKKQKVSETHFANGYTRDAWTNEQLDKWILAKRSKDFETADAIRNELRSKGIDPNTVRPHGWDGDRTGGAKDGYTGDAWTDGQLDKWTAAKRSKDFETADGIRDELRAKGIDPNTVRPLGWDGYRTGGAKDGYTGEAWTDGQLDKWITAKRSKDFETADAIRDELRAIGVDPNTVRPQGWQARGTSGAKDGYTGDAWTDGQLDQWITAKRAKDFATADAIRNELRAKGVDPNTVRPIGWDSSGAGCGAGGANAVQQSPMMQMMGKGDMSSQQNPMMQMMQMMMQMSGSGFQRRC